MTCSACSSASRSSTRLWSDSWTCQELGLSFLDPGEFLGQDVVFLDFVLDSTPAHLAVVHRVGLLASPHLATLGTPLGVVELL